MLIIIFFAIILFIVIASIIGKMDMLDTNDEYSDTYNNNIEDEDY